MRIYVKTPDGRLVTRDLDPSRLEEEFPVDAADTEGGQLFAWFGLAAVIFLSSLIAHLVWLAVLGGGGR